MQLGPTCPTVVDRLLKKLQKLTERSRSGEVLDQADMRALVEAQMEMLSILDTVVQATARETAVPVEWPDVRPVAEVRS
jgi:hypothetical protein